MIWYFFEHPNIGWIEKRIPTRIPLDDRPCPTVTAKGTGDAKHGMFFLEDDGVSPKQTSNNGKPPYRVPSMAEIKRVPPNGLTVVSTFSGAGGSCLGLKMTGCKVLWANEFIPAAQEVYAANHPDTILDMRDIRKVKPGDILKAIGLAKGELDILEGSPPCASFSMSGRRNQSWNKESYYSDTRQRTDDLFFEYARLLRGLQPRVFIAENVSGLIRGIAKGYFLDILAKLKACGYIVESRLVNAKWLGVPQDRARVIFLGVRKDIAAAHDVKPTFPTPLPYTYSVREAICDLLDQDVDVPRGAQLPDGTAVGNVLDDLRPGKTSERYFNLHRAHEDTPSPTVTAEGGIPGSASVIHPNGRRKFTIPEVKRICAFPDDFILVGSFTKQWERLGRSVPPVMMMHIGLALRESIFDVIRRSRGSGGNGQRGGRSRAGSRKGSGRRGAG